ncbi:uncharacterized protein [Asterias amurensis]|uniref:uncharacterized protein n=1 Tax=Asterias amurensis TaxID=7602 RepID=UPI003AB83503
MMPDKTIPVFNKLSAWFSKSVSLRRQSLWVKHGGKIVELRKAQFIFSQDPESFDTKSLFLSDDFHMGLATVFHAGYIDACLKNKSAHNTVISKYVLLPDHLAKELHRVRISREKRNETPDSTTAPHRSNLRDPLPEGRRADQRMVADAPSRNRTATDSEMDWHAGTSNELRSFEDRAEGRPVAAQALSEEQRMETAAGQFQNQEISKIPHVRELPQVSGPIVDFVVGRNGYSVQMNT